MADHPHRSAFRGLNWVLKSLVRRINSSGDIVMHGFWRFSLKQPIHAPFWGSFGGIFSPHDVTHRPDSQKDRGWAETRRLRYRKNQYDGSIWACDREKKNSITKVTKVLYFPYLGGSFRCTDSTQKLHVG